MRCRGPADYLDAVAVAGLLLLLLPPEDGGDTFVDSDQLGELCGETRHTQVGRTALFRLVVVGARDA